MKKIIILFVFGLLLIPDMLAQKEANNWAFGQNIGLTWNTTQSLTATGLLGTTNATLDGLPTYMYTSIVTQEGCFSLSDKNGNLLFYSDGKTIWNKNNVAMANGTGLTGHDSSAQSGIILPYPGSADKYIAVAININWTNGLSCSVIDMTLDGGLGDVVSGQKNIALSGGSGGIGESVTSIRHANGVDYWVVAPGRGTPSYLNAWLVTSSGVEATTPVVTQAPSGVTITQTSACGYIKFTADGKHFAWGGNDATFMYGDFDNSTGQFSNLRKVAGLVNTYGLEFSPSMKYLYIGGTKVLYVFDFDALLATSDPTTVTPKYFSFGVDRNTPQLAPDGRIYMCAYQQRYLYVIDNPDEYDNLKIYQLPNTFLGTTGQCRIGLPSFAASWFNIVAKASPFVCTENSSKLSLTLSLIGVDIPDRLVWDFGDGSATVTQSVGVTTGTVTFSQYHTYDAVGAYTIVITPYKADGTELAKTEIEMDVKDCEIRTNRMIRQDLQNSVTKTINR